MEISDKNNNITFSEGDENLRGLEDELRLQLKDVITMALRKLRRMQRRLNTKISRNVPVMIIHGNQNYVGVAKQPKRNSPMVCRLLKTPVEVRASHPRPRNVTVGYRQVFFKIQGTGILSQFTFMCTMRVRWYKRL